jgi:hypothetical protein
LTLKAFLDPGTYVIEVGSWTPDQSGQVAYQLWSTLEGAGENPTPLTSGPAPVLRMRLADVSTPGILPPTSIPVVPGGEAAATSPTVVGLPGGLLRLLGGGPLGGADGNSATRGAQLVRSPEPFEGGPSLALIVPPQSGGDADPLGLFGGESLLLVLEPGARPEAASETPLVSITDTVNGPQPDRLPGMIPDAITDVRVPRTPQSAPTGPTAKRERVQAALVPIGDQHNGWVAVLAAIAAFAAVRRGRRPTPREGQGT